MMIRKNIRKRILPLVLAAMLVVSDAGYGNLPIVYAQEDEEQTPTDKTAEENTDKAEKTTSAAEESITEETKKQAADEEAPASKSEETASDESEPASKNEETTEQDASTYESEETVKESESASRSEETAAEQDTDENGEETEEALTNGEEETTESTETETEEEETETEEAQELREDEAASEIATGECGKTDADQVKWSLTSDGVLTISGQGKMCDYEGTFSGQNMYDDAPEWEQYLNTIKVKKVVFGDGITYIGNNAFNNHENWRVEDRYSELESVELSGTIESIGRYAFYDCLKLKEINFTKKITKIEEGAFWGAGLEGSIQITDPVEIGRCAFQATKIETANIKYKDNTSVIEGTFKDCPNLKSITLDGNITAIEDLAFHGCVSLEKVYIPDAAPDLKGSEYANGSGGAFGDCGMLSTLDIPKGIKNIGPSVFYNCKNLKSVKIADGATEIGKRAFYNCQSLEELTIPSSITKIDDNAFSSDGPTGPSTINCGLKEIIFEERSDNIPLTIGYGAFSNCSQLEKVIIPNNTEVDRAAFSNCELTSVEIGDNVVLGEMDWNKGSAFISNKKLETVKVGENVQIGGGTFSDCSALETVNVGSGTQIGSGAFENCKSLVNVELEEGVKTIYDRAFIGCESLKTIELPETIESIPGATFENCTNLISVVVHGKKTTISENVSNDPGVKYPPFKGCPNTLKIWVHKNSDAHQFVKTKNIKYNFIVEKVVFDSDAVSDSLPDLAEENTAELKIQLLPTEQDSDNDYADIKTAARQITWESSDEKVATIEGPSTAEDEAAATITGVGKGTCTITVTCDGIEVSCTLTVLERVKPVTYTPEAGIIGYGEEVTLSCSTEGADIYYTTDGSDPAKDSAASSRQQYTTPIVIEKDTTIKAYAVKKDCIDSSVTEVAYIVSEVTGIAFEKDNYDIALGDIVELTLRLTPDTATAKSIRWESSNSEILSIETEEDGQDTNEKTGVAVAKLKANGIGQCTVTAYCDGKEATCTISIKKRVEPVKITLGSEPDATGTIPYGTTVTLSTDTEDAKIYYILDTDLDKADQEGVLYEEPIVLENACEHVIRAWAVNEEMIDSEISEAVFTVAEKIVITEIALDSESLQLGLEETRRLKVSWQPADVIVKEITWTSDDSEIASVRPLDEDISSAEVIAKKEGTCNITAVCGELKASCTVTVSSEKRVSKVYTDPAAGAVKKGTEIVLKCDTEGTEIHYTLDGSVPTKASTLYTTAIKIDKKLTIKAIAFKEGYQDSEVSEYVFTIKEEEPGDIAVTGISLAPLTLQLGLEEAGQLTVSFQPANAASQSITWRSSNPDIASVQPTNDVSAMVTGKKEGTCTITAACGKFTADCEVTVTGKKRVLKVYSVPASGSVVTPGTEVSLICDTKGADIYYTLDGSTPTKRSTPYTRTLILDDDTIIKAIAVKDDYQGSTVSELIFTVNAVIPDIPEISTPKTGIWTTTIADQSYTGSAIKPTLYVYNNNKLLTEKTDYTLSYKNNKNLGEAQVVIKGKGNYAGQTNVSFKIVEKSIDDKDVIIEDMAFASDGKPHKKAPTITYNGKKLKEDKDFEVDYGSGDFKQEGIYPITITGKGNYTGTAAGKIVILGKDKLLSKATVSSIPKQEYNKGHEITLEESVLQVRMGGKNGKLLIRDEDYTVSYVNNIGPGTATVVIKGIGGYAGTKKVTFKIVRTPVKMTEVTCNNKESFKNLEFVKGGCTPQPVLEYEGYILRAGTDYTVSYKNNKRSGGQARLVLNGKGNFKGKKEISFNIDKKDISNVAMRTLNVAYTGKANKYQSKPILTDTDGVLLKAGTDYTVTYLESETTLDKRSNPDKGAVLTVVVTGKGNYKGSRSDTYILDGISFSTAKIQVKNQNYTGKAVTLCEEDIESATIKVSGDTSELKYGVDYEIVSYSNNIKKGTATAVFSGIGKYSGEKTVKFKIVNQNINADK